MNHKEIQNFSAENKQVIYTVF